MLKRHFWGLCSHLKTRVSLTYKIKQTMMLELPCHYWQTLKTTCILSHFTYLILTSSEFLLQVDLLMISENRCWKILNQDFLDSAFKRSTGTYFIVSHSEHGCEFSCVLNPAILVFKYNIVIATIIKKGFRWEDEIKGGFFLCQFLYALYSLFYSMVNPKSFLVTSSSQITWTAKWTPL